MKSANQVETYIFKKDLFVWNATDDPWSHNTFLNWVRFLVDLNISHIWKNIKAEPNPTQIASITLWRRLRSPTCHPGPSKGVCPSSEAWQGLDSLLRVCGWLLELILALLLWWAWSAFYLWIIEDLWTQNYAGTQSKLI